MKRLIGVICVVAALALPQGAWARVIELGAGAEPAKSNCPMDPCQAIGRVTGYQGRADSLRNPFYIRRSGVIVAFTVTLPSMTPGQVQHFSTVAFRGPPSVRLAILRKGKRRRTRLDHRLMRQSKVYELQRYLGSSPTFALDRPLRVHKGYVVGLTVPTWTPSFAFSGLSGRNWWRSSRQKGDCRADTPPPAAHEERLEVVRYGCTYFRARLLYTATYIPDPRPTDQTSR
jgi:hypothetical protein